MLFLEIPFRGNVSRNLTYVSHSALTKQITHYPSTIWEH